MRNVCAAVVLLWCYSHRKTVLLPVASEDAPEASFSQLLQLLVQSTKVG